MANTWFTDDVVLVRYIAALSKYGQYAGFYIPLML